MAIPLLRDRVLLRAFADFVDAQLPDFERDTLSYEDFQQAPLDSDAKWVVSADVASYFQYVDHSLVAERIIETTGRADAAEAVVSLLRALLDRSFGLPQGPGGSGLFAGLLLAPVEWRLAERGYTVARYADDFRLACATATEADQAIEQLQSELYALGLTLNESKTRLRRRETYEESLDAFRRVFVEILGEVLDAEERAAVGPYDGIDGPEEPESITEPAEPPPDVLRAAGVKLVEAWSGSRSTDAYRRGGQRTLVVQALDLLRRSESDFGLSYGRRFLARDPSLARAWAQYAAAIANDPFADVLAAVEEIFDDPAAVSPWVLAWTCEPILQSREEPSPLLVERLKTFCELREAPPSMRARALLALAVHQEVSGEYVSSFGRSLGPQGNPDVAAAAGFVMGADSQQLRGIKSRGYVDRLIADRAAHDTRDRSWL